jgi:sarcosine oxidase subunit beta
MEKDTNLPAHAEVVIIGGGVIGSSIAYHLGERGFTDVVVLEKDEIASGASSKAGGILVRFFPTEDGYTMMNYSFDIFEKFHEEGDIELHRAPWFLPVRENDDEEMKQLMKAGPELGRKIGVKYPSRFLTPEEALKYIPDMRTENISPCGHDLGRLEGVVCSPENDAWADPYEVSYAYAKHARKMGIDIRTKIEVESILVEDGKVCGVETSAGKISCKYVVNAAGAWSPKIAKMVGLDLPVKPTRRVLLMINPKERKPYKLPNITDECEAMTTRKGLWFREDIHGYVGSGSHEAIGLDDAIDPDDFDGSYTQDDVLDFSEKLEQFFTHFGDFEVIDGWASFYATVADGSYIIDKLDSPENFIICTGFCGGGISASGGAGRVASELILDGKITFIKDPSVLACSTDRFPQLKK